MDAQQITLMDVSDLRFDHRNPRLVEFDMDSDVPDNEVIQILWEAMDVKEIVLSIAASGFFPHEPVIVASEHGKNVVIEGNRRLAAVRILLDPVLADDLPAADLPRMSEDERAKLRRIPTILHTRKDIWRFVGFKHVNGPAKWSSYAKSKYIADVHKNYNIPLAEIARQIGDTHNTVQRLFQALMVIEQAERFGVFDRKDRWDRHFSSSHLYTGIGYANIAEFIGLGPRTEENPEPVPEERKSELGELFLWMYGSRNADAPPVLRKQNPHLRYLAEIVASRDGLAALRRGVAIDVAHELSRPPSTVLEERLHTAKRSLQDARGLVSTGYERSKDMLTIAGTVANLADDLYDEMERKYNKRKKMRLSESI